MPTLDDRLNAVPIADAKPSDRPHILVWDTCDEDGLEKLRFRHGTYRAYYAKDLLTRHEAQSSSTYLFLHKRIDREIQALRNLCETSPTRYIQLEGLDRLISYLAFTNSSDLDMFWQKLLDLRQLTKLLWIILPSSLVPAYWPDERLYRLDSSS
jgi:hypothetical protein